MIRNLSFAALAVLVVVTMSGCAGGGAVAHPSNSPATSAAAPDPSESPVLRSGLDDRCDGLASPDDYKGLWDDDLVAAAYSSYGAGSSAAMSGTALVQSEAMLCTWLTADGDPAAIMIAMGGGEDGFRRTEAAFTSADGPYAAVPILDGAYSRAVAMVT